MRINEEQVTTNEGGYIPEQVYRVRVLNTKFDMRSSQNKPPMTTLSLEVIEPETADINGKEVIIAGRKFPMYLVHDVTKAGWGSQDQVMEFCGKLQIELPVGDNGKPEYETDDHARYFKGLEFDIPLSCKQQVKLYGSGPDKGKPMLDASGKQIDLGYQIQANPSDLPDDPRPSKNEIIAAQPY
jgi:hypothetical protein